MFGQEAAGHVERANLTAERIENLTRRCWRIHHADSVRADTVVEERQRMQQYSSSFTCKRLRERCYDGLRCGAKLVTKHDHDVARGVCNCLARGIDRARFDTGFLR